MKWENVLLNDIIDLSNGINFNKAAYSAGVKLIGVSNFGDRFSPDYEELQEVSEKAVRKQDYLQDGDIVFVRSCIRRSPTAAGAVVNGRSAVPAAGL